MAEANNQSKKFHYFEDFYEGMRLETSSVRLEEAEIIDFASRYDPQYFHTDRERAMDSHFGGLVASGWHTSCLVMRLLCDDLINHSSSLGSRGLDEIRWLKPVRPGDSIRASLLVTATTPCRSKPEQRGWVMNYLEVLNQHDEVVMTWKGQIMFGRRTQAQTAS